MIVLILSGYSNALKVATFQEDGSFRTDSFLKHRETLGTRDSTPLMTNLSLCLWVQLTRFRGVSNRLMSYATEETDDALTLSTLLFMKHETFQNNVLIARFRKSVRKRVYLPRRVAHEAEQQGAGEPQVRRGRAPFPPLDPHLRHDSQDGDDVDHHCLHKRRKRHVHITFDGRTNVK